MSKKKFLTKNEFRYDLNPKHMGEDKKPHPAYISGRRGHNYYANSVTHARFTNSGATHNFGENPNKTHSPTDLRESRVSLPFWQKNSLFGKEKLNNYRYSNQTRKAIKKFNRKFDDKKQ